MQRMFKAALVVLCCDVLLYRCLGQQHGSKFDADTNENILGKVFNRLNAIEAKCEVQAGENAELWRKIEDLEALVSTLQAENQQMGKQIRVLQAHDQMFIDERKEMEDFAKDEQRTKDDMDALSADDSSHIEARTVLDQSKTVVPKSGPGSRRNLRRFQESEHDVNVAFFAKISDHHLEHLGVNQAIVFDHVITNVGNAYNSFTGDFRAPVSGTYVFSLTLMSLGAETVHCKMEQNGIGVANIYVYTDTADATSSMTAVLELKQGEDLVIRNIQADVKIHGYGYSYFSGFLLRQNYTNPDIIGK